jgi:hypothetical protein
MFWKSEIDEFLFRLPSAVTRVALSRKQLQIVGVCGLIVPVATGK